MIICRNIGLVDYGEAWNYQQKLFDEAIARKVAGLPAENVLILCQHPHTLTLGKHGKEENLLVSDEMLGRRGVSLFRTDRGGDITYHGPGQLVGYPIFDLESLDMGLKKYIHTMEECIIGMLGAFGIRSGRCEGAAGVWLDADDERQARKICAIGVRSSRYVTMHGFALNVNTDLSYFSLINPCGFTDRGVTSIQQELDAVVSMDAVADAVCLQFQENFIIK